MPSRKYFSDTPVVLQIIDLYTNQNLTCRWIEKIVGIDHCIVKNILIENNIPISGNRKRQPLTEEHKNRFAYSRKGSKLSKEEIEKREATKRSRKHLYNIKRSEDNKKAISETLKKKYKSGEIIHARGTLGRTGPLSSNWRGGMVKLNQLIRNSVKYIEWRSSVFKRDGFICINVDCKSKKQIEADHIKPLALLLRDNDIKNIDQALECAEIWDINNGRTLCKKCHKETETYGSKLSKLMKNEL